MFSSLTRQILILLHAKSCFETFPFPADLTPQDTAHQQTRRLESGAVVPLGMSVSPYPDRIVPKAGHEKSLSDRTLTKLYNARPDWLKNAHAALDAAVATAYGWTDYTADMPDETILQRLLALNVERSVAQK